MARSFLGSGAYLDLDASDLAEKIDLLRGIMTRPRFEQLIYRTFGEVAKKSRTMISREVRKDYVVHDRWVRGNIGDYKLSMGGGGGVNCVIPLSSHKGIIGGEFKMRRAKTSRKSGRIYAGIVKAQTSTMPQAMKNQGGNPPFVAKGLAFTRRTKARLPIVRVVGLGVPQMPLNRSEDNVREALLEYAMQRLDHNFGHMMGGGR